MKDKNAQIALLVNMEDPCSVYDEVKFIIKMIYNEFNFNQIDKAFNDIVNLFNGKYPGYRTYNTKYHDLKHTTDSMLCFIRLIHGASLMDIHFTKEEITLSIIAALMHDTGYIQKKDDLEGTGAKYTLIHIQRSMDFMDKYFSGNSFDRNQLKICNDMLNCTGLNTRIEKINFSSPCTELLGKMLGTADLIGQMADRTYLEKLVYLYYEFKEGGVKGYKNEFDFFKKTIDFYRITKKRLKHDLGGVSKYLSFHFKERHNIDCDLYEKTIQSNIEYLNHIISDSDALNYREKLRRGGIIKSIEEENL
ncbi:MAG: hypothetical protein HQK76_13925 [Desulfobacterales bacterium]|nr:hypothetical protein [Desulfobacterales bacterium]